MNLTEKATKVLTDALEIGKRHLIESNHENRTARDILLTGEISTEDRTEETKEQIRGLEEDIEDTVFSLNTIDRIIYSMERREPIVYHNQVK